jgi:hypothetical protein
MGIKSGKNPTLDKLQQTNLSMSMPLVYQVYSMLKHLKHQCSGTGGGGGGVAREHMLITQHPKTT